MFASLSPDFKQWMSWSWTDFKPFVDDLLARALNADTLEEWMRDWSRLDEIVTETYNRLYVATTVNTADPQAEEQYKRFLDEIYPNALEADQALKQKLLDSELEPAGFEIPLRNLRAEADLYRAENLPLLTEEQKLKAEYDKIVGAQTVAWEGQERTVTQMRTFYQDADRERREQAWRLAAERQLADRQAIDALWQKFVALRQDLAKNAGKSDYRAYRWQQLLRFDYTPADCLRFHKAIEEAVVPAAKRIYEKRRRQLGVETLRPWDLDVDALGRPPLRPFNDVTTLRDKIAGIFDQVDPQLGEYYQTMVREGLLDLANRKNKAPGAYSIDYPRIRRPFVFANAVGLHDDVQTLLHEGGHAFHTFEVAHLPYVKQLLMIPMEFAEVASMGMEFLGGPYLAEERGGFYTPADAARARIEHMEGAILFWPYMAVVDAFQHWAYENPEEAKDPQKCDAEWTGLWQRFMPGVDWSGLEDVMATGWHRKLHIHTYPLYYVEYGLAQLGAVQVWRNSLSDPAGAVAAYRRALSRGATVPLPKLFEAAGARLAFDAETLGEGVELMERTIEELEKT